MILLIASTIATGLMIAGIGTIAELHQLGKHLKPKPTTEKVDKS